MSNFILIKENNTITKKHPEKFFDNDRIDLSDDDISLILDSLCESADYQDSIYNKAYAKALKKVAKRINKLWE